MTTARRQRGSCNYHSGLAAETRVEHTYCETGHTLVARRWRGSRGEIDLVFRQGDVISFVEVKKARDFARAAESLRPAQMRRIAAAAEEFLGTLPAGALTECRFDVGLVNQSGACEIIVNAFDVHQ